MNEQLVKRLQDSLRMLSVCLEQMEEIGWLFKDIIGDLELETLQTQPELAEKDPGPGSQETQTKQDVAPQ